MQADLQMCRVHVCVNKKRAARYTDARDAQGDPGVRRAEKESVRKTMEAERVASGTKKEARRPSESEEEQHEAGQDERRGLQRV